MRILLNCSNLVVGGAIQVALGVITEAAAERGFTWDAVVSAELGDQIPSSIEQSLSSLTKLPRESKIASKHRAYKVLKQLDQTTRPDVAFTVFGPTLWRPRCTHLMGFAIPRIIYPEHVNPGNTSAYFEAREALVNAIGLIGFRRADVLVVETNTVRDRLQRILKISPSKVVVIGNSFSKLFGAEEWHYRKVGGDKFRILVPSSYYPHKNLESIPRVASELAGLAERKFEFTMTLAAHSKPWNVIQKMAARLGVGDMVSTVGVVPHKKFSELYQNADAVFLPTLLECSTAVYPESFVSRVPLCTSDRDFARELCGAAALYFDPLQPRQGAQVLAKLMGDETLRSTLIKEGLQVMKKNYMSPSEKWLLQLRCIQESAGAGRAAASKDSSRA